MGILDSTVLPFTVSWGAIQSSVGSEKVIMTSLITHKMEEKNSMLSDIYQNILEK